MNFNNWHNVKQIFNSALDLDPGEREAYLAVACAGDAGLRQKVEDLLNSYRSEFMEKPVVADPEAGGDLAIGSFLGRHEIIRLIGFGGMGKVYLATDNQLDRKVAIKVLNQKYENHETSTQRFIQEAKAASALNHPNILTIHDIGQSETGHFIVMELVAGKPLSAIIATDNSVGTLLSLGSQMAKALSAAHAAGITHRDIKPENIMVRDDGYLKILDFGLARLVPVTDTDAEAPALMRQTAPGAVLGTVAYMSPEQARGEPTGPPSDIFALGIVFYELVTGQHPFRAETPLGMLHLINSKTPASPSIITEGAAGALDELILRMLAKDARLRPTAMEVERALSQISVASSTSSVSDTREAGEVAPAYPSVRGNLRNKFVIIAFLFVVITGSLIYWMVTRPKAVAESPSHPAVKSIAVLPFELVNAEPNSESEYFSDGISESLINKLSQLPDLKVIARSSSFKYKGKEVDAEEAARALGVEYLLSGRVWPHGEQIQISVALMNVHDKTQMWGAQYNRNVSDLLAIQAEVSREIAGNLRLKLATAEQQQLARSETATPQAYELLLKGRFYRNKGGTENTTKAVDYLNQSLAVDPKYALAYAELSISYQCGCIVSDLNPREFLPKAVAAAQKALELDESLAEAHLGLAMMKENDWDWATAKHEYERAIKLNANLASAYNQYASFLSIIGRNEEALAVFKRARELDPLSPQINIMVGVLLYIARQYDQGIEAMKKMIELDPNYPYTYQSMGFNYAGKGMFTEAIGAYREANRLGDVSPTTHIYLGAAYAKAGEVAKARAILKRLQMSGQYVSPAELAVLYTALNEHEQAFASLERAYAAHDLQLKYLGADPAFDPLRSDPRFTDLILRVGLPH